MTRRFLAALVTAWATVAGAVEPSLEVHLDPRRFGIEDATLLVVRIVEPQGTPEVDLGSLDNLEVVSGPSTRPSSRGSTAPPPGRSV